MIMGIGFLKEGKVSMEEYNRLQKVAKRLLNLSYQEIQKVGE